MTPNTHQAERTPTSANTEEAEKIVGPYERCIVRQQLISEANKSGVVIE